MIYNFFFKVDSNKTNFQAQSINEHFDEHYYDALSMINYCINMKMPWLWTKMTYYIKNSLELQHILNVYMIL